MSDIEVQCRPEGDFCLTGPKESSPAYINFIEDNNYTLKDKLELYKKLVFVVILNACVFSLWFFYIAVQPRRPPVNNADSAQGCYFYQKTTVKIFTGKGFYFKSNHDRSRHG